MNPNTPSQESILVFPTGMPSCVDFAHNANRLGRRVVRLDAKIERADCP